MLMKREHSHVSIVGPVKIDPVKSGMSFSINLSHSYVCLYFLKYIVSDLYLIIFKIYKNKNVFTLKMDKSWAVLQRGML